MEARKGFPRWGKCRVLSLLHFSSALGKFGFSDPQAGNVICNCKIASLKTHLRWYIVCQWNNKERARQKREGVKSCANVCLKLMKIYNSLDSFWCLPRTHDFPTLSAIHKSNYKLRLEYSSWPRLIRTVTKLSLRAGQSRLSKAANGCQTRWRPIISLTSGRLCLARKLMLYKWSRRCNTLGELMGGCCFRPESRTQPDYNFVRSSTAHIPHESTECMATGMGWGWGQNRKACGTTWCYLIQFMQVLSADLSYGHVSMQKT